MRIRLGRAGLITLFLLLGGCGFHLREARPLAFHTLYLQVSPGEPFGQALQDQLEAQPQLTLTRSASEAEVQLQILGAGREEAILSLNTAGRVREKTLRQRVRFQVLDGKGEVLSEPRDLVVERVLSFSDANTLSKENEVGQIYVELQSDTVRLLLLRLAALKLPARDGR